MIPLELQDELIKRLEEEFRNFKLKNIKSEQVPINLFPQHLPAKDKNQTDPYPCIIIRLDNGEQPGNNDPNYTSIQFIIGVVDRESTFQGYRDSITVANRIIQNITRNPKVKDKYELDIPISWVYHDEDAEPYFFSGIETNWSTPKYIREDVEDMI